MMVPVVFLVLPVTVLFAFWPGVVGLHLTDPLTRSPGKDEPWNTSHRPLARLLVALTRPATA